MKASLFILFILFNVLLCAQDPCAGSKKGFVFQANRIGAFYNPGGSKFFDFHDGYFKVPYTSEKSPSTIFACSPWMGGYVNNELRLSGQTYASPKIDLFLSPLGPSSVPYNNCNQFDKVWSVSRDEIEQHIQDYALDGIIDDTLSSIFGWPAQGNSFFSKINGFDLPDDHQGGWADFADINQNGIYEPHLGEYPIVYLKSQPQIPQLISWMVFNDHGEHLESKGIPLGAEFQLTVFGFNCEENDVLNNTIFNNYKIINQGANEIDSTYFGMWTDYDLGCASDDYLGCDSLRSSEFVYNDEVDGDVGIECSNGQNTFGNYPPVQSLTWLNPRMHSFVSMQRPFLGKEIWPTYQNDADQYHLLAGYWADGKPIRIGGDGYNVDTNNTITRFLFNGNPNDLNQWSSWQAGIDNIDIVTLSSVYLGSIMPGSSTLVETAYTFHQDSSGNNLAQFEKVYANLDSLLVYVENINSHCHPTPVCSSRDCVWPGDFNHNGIADHFDLLYWGVDLDSSGPKRDGLINWNGHYADPWTLILPDNLNSKHGDGNGDGQVTTTDLERNEIHFLFTNPYYSKKDTFPLGPEISISAFPMDSNGNIPRIEVIAQRDIPNVLGMAFELDFDTTYFTINTFNFIYFPVDTNLVFFNNGEYTANENRTLCEGRYAFVKTNHSPDTIQTGFQILRFLRGLKLKEEFSIDDLPDTIVIRLKNLIALDPNGNDLHIGSNTLKVPSYLITGASDPYQSSPDVVIYPNPADQTISIETELKSDILIFNPQGQIAKKIPASAIHQPIDISSLVPGIYFFKFSGFGNTYKFVKQ